MSTSKGAKERERDLMKVKMERLQRQRQPIPDEVFHGYYNAKHQLEVNDAKDELLEMLDMFLDKTTLTPEEIEAALKD